QDQQADCQQIGNFNMHAVGRIRGALRQTRDGPSGSGLTRACSQYASFTSTNVDTVHIKTYTQVSASRMARNQDLYLISVAARMLGMHPQTLRKYERLGLVRP